MELITELRTNFDTTYLFVSNFGEKYLPKEESKEDQALISIEYYLLYHRMIGCNYEEKPAPTKDKTPIPKRKPLIY